MWLLFHNKLSKVEIWNFHLTLSQWTWIRSASSTIWSGGSTSALCYINRSWNGGPESLSSDLVNIFINIIIPVMNPTSFEEKQSIFPPFFLLWIVFWNGFLEFELYSIYIPCCFLLVLHCLFQDLIFKQERTNESENKRWNRGKQSRRKKKWTWK